MRNVRLVSRVASAAAVMLAVTPAGAFTPEEVAAAAGVAREVEADVRVYASDALEGRRMGTPGGLAARELLIDQLVLLGAGLAPGDGRDAYVQSFDSEDVAGLGNVLAVIPGSIDSEEYVVVGAHYDHLGVSGGASSGDSIYNGATDDAAGVAIVLAIGRALRALPVPPSRSVVLAFWDGEESGLLGSRYFTNVDPLVPLADIATYVNFDIQGSNLLPSLRNTSFAIGAETGGDSLSELTTEAIGATDLDTRLLSLTFGQGRSDHQPFWAKKVPVVFFSDATNACYHTPGDEVELVDFHKLARQGEIGFRTVLALAESIERPAFAPLLAFDTYEDLLVLAELLTRGLVDLPLLESGWADQLVSIEARARALVEDGPDAFGPTDALLIAQDTLTIAESGIACDAALLPEPGAIGAAVAFATLALRARRRNH